MQFENSIIETKYSLHRKFKNYMKVNKDVYVIDLGFKIPIYEHYIKRKINIEYWMAKDFLNNHLTNIANAYKQYDERIIETMLKSEAEKIQRIAKGSILTNQYLEYCIDNALINKDTIEVEYNSSIRFLINPYYKFKANEFINKQVLKDKLINSCLGNEKKKANNQLIYSCISDHDCNKGSITKKSLSQDSKLSLRTINNYLKEYLLLNEYFNKVKELSTSDKQRIRKQYNRAS